MERNYEAFYFEVRTKSGKLVATFQTRWMAEEFAMSYGFVVTQIHISK